MQDDLSGEIESMEKTTAFYAALQVPYKRLTRDQKLVREHVPGAGLDPALLELPPQLFAPALYPFVVLERDGLAVEDEALVAGVRFHNTYQVVNQANQPGPEDLEREVPLPVSVGVGYQK